MCAGVAFQEDKNVAEPHVDTKHVRRLVTAEGRFNFRDIGGYKTEDGRITRWGRVYRSGMMAHFTDAGHAAISKLGIRLICDLRTTREREEAPTRWQDAGVADYWARDYDLSRGELSRMMESEDNAADEVRNAMIGNYRKLAFEQAESYRHLFARLAEGHLPLVFNCSAGKDRTKSWRRTRMSWWSAGFSAAAGARTRRFKPWSRRMRRISRPCLNRSIPSAGRW
jgi:hypothetical protein